MEEEQAEDRWLPWESRVGPATFARTLYNVALYPVQTFRAANRDVGMARSLVFVMITSLAALPTSLFPQVFGRFSFAMLAGQEAPTVNLVEKYGLLSAAARTFGVSVLAVPLGLVMFAVLLNFLLSLAGVEKPAFNRCVRAASYHAAIVFVLGVFPLMGAVVGLPWGAYVLYGATMGFFDLTPVRAMGVTAGYVLGGIALQVAPVLMASGGG